MADSQQPSKGGPSDFLKTVIGRPVIVKLNSGVDYRGAPSLPSRSRAPILKPSCSRVCRPSLAPAGILACLDGYMNIAMEQTEEYVNGQLKAKYGDAFIRGNNGAPLMREWRASPPVPLTSNALLHPNALCPPSPPRSPVHQHAEEEVGIGSADRAISASWRLWVLVVLMVRAATRQLTSGLDLRRHGGLVRKVSRSRTAGRLLVPKEQQRLHENGPVCRPTRLKPHGHGHSASPTTRLAAPRDNAESQSHSV
jgi:U6 snRNA-associated Sm-like protein LSm6